MAATPASDVTDGPVLSVINKRLRALRKKHNRIVQLEEAVALGKSINKEQEDVLRSKPSVSASMDELEKLRLPLSAAVTDEIKLALTATDSDTKADEEKGQNAAELEQKLDQEQRVVEDLLNLLYFGTMFDVKSQNDVTSTMLTRTHERACCLTYDYVTDDDSTDMLGERDLDLISMLRGLLISRAVDSSLSHKNALEACIYHANQWLSNSDHPIDSDPNVTYARIKAKLNKIMGSEYFTKTPEMKAPVEMAAAGNYAPFQIPVHGPMVSVRVEDSDELYQDETKANVEGNVTWDNQPSHVEEPHKGENHMQVPSQAESDDPRAEGQNTTLESNEQHNVGRRNYQNQRNGRGGGSGGHWGYPNGRGGRGSSRGGGAYQNGHNQYYGQSGNYYYPRNSCNSRGRGDRGRGDGGGNGNFYNHSSGAQGNHALVES